YRSVSGPVPEPGRPAPLGEAALARQGSAATVVTYGAGVRWALDAAEVLSAEGIEVEVVDLRWLRPWDHETVLTSVQRTGRVLIVHEAPRTGGFGAEVAATVAEAAFTHLDAPVARLGALDTPVPFSRPLEALHSPQPRLLAELRRLLAF
ncbi:MAG: transketolase C-terminal domain-containing protein, partial [Acidimicrobiia bacterium]